MIPPFTPFELKAESAVKHRVKITFKDGAEPFIGYCSGFTRAIDNDPEVASIDVQYRKSDNWGVFFEESDIDDIIILD